MASGEDYYSEEKKRIDEIERRLRNPFCYDCGINDRIKNIEQNFNGFIIAVLTNYALIILLFFLFIFKEKY